MSSDIKTDAHSILEKTALNQEREIYDSYVMDSMKG